MAITHNDFDIYENWVSAQLVVLLLGHWERVGVEERGKDACDRRGELRVLEREREAAAWVICNCIDSWTRFSLALNLVEGWTLYYYAASTVIYLLLLLCILFYIELLYYM